MQTDLSHLPESKRRELDEIVRLIRAQTTVEMIILYGSYARGDWKEAKDVEPQGWSGHPSDYDLLIVVADQKQAEDVMLWRKVTDSLNNAELSAPARAIVHDINEMNMALVEHRYFFVDLYEEGRVLFDSGRFQLDEPDELGVEARKSLAEEYFKEWMHRAQRFYRYYQVGVEEDDWKGAAFSLNQATESAYKCILLVHTLYSPHEHLLDKLGLEASEFGPVFREIFPVDTPELEHNFDQLDRAYIGSRYKTRFKVTREELDDLAPKVAKLLEVAERLCQKEIERLGAESSS
ncbi:HEPN domain-containing protein [Saccharospirillum salsuginis]|uniref:Nucleotidyltransferase n=1 Tax=Saccharospirillum salsuginis TaxID=418750 RepID=A0A918KB83_9GAMM|nr:HEPN domain-containing protein [Saccharospirillum salsuginis]GGX57466.1 nucleotidyltransferase [Saccharospirillum salsuginis]